MAPPQPRTRMTATQRREQLIVVGRDIFASDGVQGATVEEIATRAGVTKPVVYEHFGGKEGLYAVVVDRAIQDILTAITNALSEPAGIRVLLERAVLALLDFMETSPSSFEVLVRSSPSWHGDGSAASLMSAIAVRVEELFEATFESHGFDPTPAPVYAQTLIGSIALTGVWWIHHEDRPDKEFVAAHIINLMWNGLHDLQKNPVLPSRVAPPTPAD
ncbi:TetR/AcrR family transcriptional regulator [Allobranchiibius sp. GilTou38]|uniref:TetR/AcrR family transcriptional regulator n=1 Tax=Allobranchiibius sp. GilTou38 TaxID=2815210 RepID=UPI001FB6468C|nr:TetR/AcrR family transcriptional regulator [Allobranchiibius sp. GilTou38]